MKRIIKGDKVKVIAGKYQGQVGKVLFVWPKTNRVTVEKINLVKKKPKKGEQNEPEVIEQEAPIALSNVALVDPKSKQQETIKISYLFNDKKEKFRANRKTQLPIGGKK